MNEHDNIDDGPVFPVQDASTWQAHGLSKRELFAAILMHSEVVVGCKGGDASAALEEAADRQGRDVVDHMASNAVEGADALLRALSEPKPVEYRELYVDERMRLNAADRLAAVAGDLKQQPAYAALPEHLRQLLEAAVAEVTEPPLPF